MRITKIGLSLLLASSLFANDKTIAEDTKNKIIKDIKKDGTNFNFFTKITTLQTMNDLNGYDVQSQDKSTVFGTIGVMFLPNTWKINVSYTGTILENSDEDKLNSYTGNYIINESKKDTNMINLYTKPISSKYGDIGFGYRAIEKNEILEHTNTNPNIGLKILDIKNPSGAGAISINGNNKYAVYNTKVVRYYSTYNIPSKNKWYEGLGIIYAYEKSNLTKQLKHSWDDVDFVLKPDVTSHLFGFGINKTIDELHNGFNLKQLVYGTIKNNYKYFNYDTNKNESYDANAQYIDLGFTYMFKAKNNKQIYLSGQSFFKVENDSDGQYSELIFEIGFLF